MLGRALAERLCLSGRALALSRRRSRAASRRADLPPTAFVSFLQNHDQIGNTPFGKRIAANAPEALVHAAVAVVLLSPQIPLLFMGEEWATSTARSCSSAISGRTLADAVREGRQREFAQFAEFGEAAAQRPHPRRDRREHLCCVPARLVGARREPHRDLA